MSVTASLDDSSVTVEPGGEADISARVLNSGPTVEEFRFEVVGPCAGWTTVEPERLSLYPGASGTAVLRLRPPRDPAIAPGETPLGLRVVPTGDADGTVIPERGVTVLPFTEVTSELVPQTSHSAWRGRHKAAVDNRGNTPVRVLLTARGGAERARLVIEPVELTVPPGQARFARLKVRPAKWVWRGTPVTHTFQLVVAPRPPEGREPREPEVLDGAYEQQALLPRWLPRALVVTALLAAAVIGLWYSVLRPTVRSAARQAITPEAVEKAVNQKDKNGTADPSQQNTGGANGQGGTTAGTAGSSGGPGSKDRPASENGASQRPGEPGGPGAPKNARVQVRAGVGGGPVTATAIEVPEGKTFELTDIVLQNPQGDAGSVVVSSQDQDLLELSLENFRDSDYHFVTPIDIPPGGKVTIAVSCREVGRPVKAPTPGQCSESLLLGGSLRADKQGNG
ncbi:hypothetical protein AB0H73_10410 [Streptomyces olivoreticuli]